MYEKNICEDLDDEEMLMGERLLQPTTYTEFLTKFIATEKYNKCSFKRDKQFLEKNILVQAEKQSCGHQLG